MEKIEIKSHELQNRICAAPEVNKFDFTDVTPEDLKSVKRLFLPGTKFNGEPTDVRLAELGAVSNLEELTLNSFVIDDRINSILAMLPNLKALEFTNCDFRDCTEMNTVKPLDFFGINIGENVEGKRFPRAVRVHVNNTSVSFDSIEWDDLKVAKFHNSTLHGVSSLDGKDGIEEIEVVDSKLFGEMNDDGIEEELKRIEVSPKTLLSIEEKDEELR